MSISLVSSLSLQREYSYHLPPHHRTLSPPGLRIVDESQSSPRKSSAHPECSMEKHNFHLNLHYRFCHLGALNAFQYFSTLLSVTPFPLRPLSSNISHS